MGFVVKYKVNDYLLGWKSIRLNKLVIKHKKQKIKLLKQLSYVLK